MSEFEPAMRVADKHEGGFVDNPNDPGGATNYGMSLRYLKTLRDDDGDGYLDGDLDHDGDVDANDVRNMEKGEAVKIYRTQWWDRYRYTDIKNQSVATKVFDLAINMGAKQTHKCLQRAVRSVSGVQLKADGILGPITLSAVNSADGVLIALRSEAAGIYRQIVAKRPLSNQFLKGWLNRAYS